MTVKDDLYCFFFVPRMYTLGPMVEAEPISMAKKYADAICVLQQHSGINFNKPNPQF